jgi:asparagine synthase (glutamine-hydrolysing)
MNGFTVLLKNKNLAGEIIPLQKKNLDFTKPGFNIKTISSDDFKAELITNGKFADDKVLSEDNDFVIGIDGVILNLKNLKQSTSRQSLFEIVKKLYLTHGEQFIANLKGEFSGFIFDKALQKWLVFTNYSGSKRVFYFQNRDYFIFSSNLSQISYLLRKLNLDPKLNIEASYLLVTNGFMLNEQTVVNDVLRLLPGNYLTFQNDHVSVTEYFNLRNIRQTHETKSQIINNINDLFNEAVRLEFEKDIQNNYEHIATLSGGLDSRMTVLTAHKLGYENQLNFTFSQSDYLDEKIAKEIAHDYHHEFLFMSLDYGNFLKNIEKTVLINDGLVTYSGSAHSLNSVEKMNFSKFGLIHTGIIGDAVIGSFLSKPYPTPPAPESGVLSKKLLHRISPLILKIQSQYPTEELYKFYGRAFLGALSGNIYLDLFSQTASPFMDFDFLTYCFSIPESLKYKQAIYLDWIETKHPEFGKYRWEKTGVSPFKSRRIFKYFSPGYYRRMNLKLMDILSGTLKSGMNPFDSWLEENHSLREYINNYYNQNIHFLSDHKELFEDCKWLFENGNSGEKFQVLTLLAAYRLNFTDLVTYE